MQGVQVIVCVVSLFLSGCQLKPLATEEEWSSASSQQLVKQVELFHRLKFCFKTFIDKLAVITSNHATSYSSQKVVNALYSHFEWCVWKVLQQNMIAKETINKETKLSIKQPINNQEHLYKQRFIVSPVAEPQSMDDAIFLSSRSFGTRSPQSHESFDAIDQRFGRNVDSFRKHGDDLTDSAQSFGKRNRQSQSHGNVNAINQRFGGDVGSFMKRGEDLSSPLRRFGKRSLPMNENFARTTQRFGRNLGENRREGEAASYPGRFGKRGVAEDAFLEGSNQRFGKNENQIHSEYPSHLKVSKRDSLSYEHHEKSDVNFDQRFGRNLKGFQTQNEGDLFHSLQNFGKRDLEVHQTFEEESQRPGRNLQGFQKRDAEGLYVSQRFGKRGLQSRKFSNK